MYMAMLGHFHWPIVPCETAALNDDWSWPRVKVPLLQQRHLSERGEKAKSPMNSDEVLALSLGVDID